MTVKHEDIEASILSNTMKEIKDPIQKALLFLSEKLGPEILDLRVAVSPNNDFDAFTTAKDVAISQRILNVAPEDIPFLIAHEIFHHIVDCHEETWMYHHTVINYAEDFKINQLIEELVGIKVEDCKNGYLRDRRFDKMTVPEIAAIVASKGNSGYAPHPGLNSNGNILNIAEAVARRFGLEKEVTFSISDPERNFLKRWAQPIKTEKLHCVDITRARDAIAQILYLEEPESEFYADHFYRWEAIVYSINAPRFREFTVGNANLSNIVANRIIENLDNEYEDRKRRIDRFTSRIGYIQVEIKNEESRNYEDRSDSKIERLKKLVDILTNRVKKMEEEPYLFDMLKDSDLKVTTRKKVKSVNSSTLKSGLVKEVEDLGLPRLLDKDLANKIFRLSSGPFREVKKNAEMMKLAAKHGFVELNEGEFGDDHEERLGDAGTGLPTFMDMPGEKPEDENFEKKLSYQKLVFDNSNIILRVIQNMADIKAKMAQQRQRQVSEIGAADIMMNFGSELDSIVLSEFALLANQETERCFFMNMAQNSLMQMNPEKKKQASVVVAVDTSGSMMDRPFEVAIGFSLAMAQMITSQGRGFSLVLFHDDAYESFDFETGIALSDIVKVFQNIQSGGTSFDPPILKAYDIKAEKNWKEMNTILITDGQGLIQEQEKIKGMKTYKDSIDFILIGSTYFKDPLVDNVYATSREGLKIKLTNCGKNFV